VKERLVPTLTVTLGGVAHTVNGGDVRAFSLAMTSYGVEGSVTFVAQNDSSRGGSYTDEILADFVKPDLGTVSLSVTAGHSDTTTATTLPAIAAGGVIVGREVSEHVYTRQLDAPDVLFRRYTVRFADPARALWRQHFPCDLFVQKTMQDVLDAHKGANVTLTYDWDLLTTTRPQVFFDLDPERGASFYDFVVWFIRTYQGVLTLDHAKGSYSIAGAKGASGQAVTLPRDDVATLIHRLPEVPRHAPRVVNSNTESAAQRVVTNASAADGVFRDVLLRTAVAQEVDDRVTLETARPLLPLRELDIAFARFPTVAMVPGSLVDVSSKGAFSSEMIPSTEPWRVHRLTVEATAIAPGPERDYGDTSTGFEVAVSAHLESQSDATPRLPSYVAPWYPGHLEGKVVSEVGEASDVTYQFTQDATTNLDIYKVKIPLFAGQIVTAPFEPQQGSGMFYIPVYKDARVVVALGFGDARIARLLDWRPGAQVPLDGQGQQLLLGKSAESNTSVLHDYESDRPVFRILRTNAKDTALIHIEEGVMKLVVQETQGE
jgi:hypothetical protein